MNIKMTASLLIFLSSLAIRLRRTKMALRGCLQADETSLCRYPLIQGIFDDLFATGIVSVFLSLLPLICCKTVLLCYFLLLLIDDQLYQQIGFRLRPELYSHFLHPKIYWSSFQSFRRTWIFPPFFLLAQGAFLYWIPLDSSWILNGILLLFGWCSTSKDHFLLMAFKRPAPVHPLDATQHHLGTFPSENAVFLSKDYPLLRLTRSWKGSKRFDIPVEKTAKPHLIFYFLESFRAKNVGCLRAKEGVTPYFDELSQTGVLFSEFYANGNATSWATISSLFGIPPAMIPSYQRYYVGFPLIGLPQIMKAEGYHPAVIQGASLRFELTHAFYQTHGFETVIGKREIQEMHPSMASTSWGIHDEGVVRYSIEWIKKQKQPVFLNLFSITNHHPWTCPPSWKRKYDHPFHDTMAYSDWALGEFIKLLEEHRLLDRSILFILGDHGQSMGEHDHRVAVHRTLYEEEVHVPLLILAKGRLKRPCVIHDPCSQMDLLPTVLDLFGYQSAHHSMGASLIRKKKHFIFLCYPLEEGAIAGRMGQYKGILKDSKEELFNLHLDPGEKHNLVAERPLRWRRFKKILQRYACQLQSLYANCALAPAVFSHGALHFVPHKEITDSELQMELARRQPLISLDLSACTCLRSVDFQIRSLRYLNLSQCLWVQNKMMNQLKSSFPSLISLNLSDCDLLSDSGIQDLLNACVLEELNLEGMTDLCNLGGREREARYLKKLNLLRCPRLDGDAFSHWIGSLPALTELRLCCENWKDEDLRYLSKKLHLLKSLVLSDGAFLSSSAIQMLIDANPSLIELSLERCPHIQNDFIASLQNHCIGYLTISNNHCITNEGLHTLIRTPLQWLNIQNCLLVDGHGLLPMSREDLTIAVSQNSCISVAEMDHLQTHGIYLQ